MRGRLAGRRTETDRPFTRWRNSAEISICDQWQFVKDREDGLYKDWWSAKNVHFSGEKAAALGQFLGEHVDKVVMAE